MAPKWTQVNCSLCDEVFSINVDWTKPPDKCQLCRLKREDIIDVIEVLLRTPAPDVSQSQKTELSQILSRSISEVDLISIDKVISILQGFDVAASRDDVYPGIELHEIQKLIRRLIPNDKASPLKNLRFEKEITWTIFDILNTHSDTRKRVLNDHIAFKLNQDKSLSKIILRAASIYRNLSKYDSEIRKRNDQRELLTFSGKRRWS